MPLLNRDFAKKQVSETARAADSEMNFAGYGRSVRTRELSTATNGARPHLFEPNPLIEAETIIAEAAKLPLKDAAFALWRQRPRLDSIEGPAMTREEIRIARALSPEEIGAKVRYQRDHAQDGPTFDRLKLAHPRADNTEARLAIIAAVKFDDACFKYFTVDDTDYWQRVVRAVALAQRQENPGYLESTYQAARNHVAYHMK